MSQVMLTTILVLSIFVGSKGQWSYKYANEWPRTNPYCSGNMQSPIDLQYNISQYNHRLENMFLVEKNAGGKLHIVNNGHSVQLELSNHYILKEVAPQSEDYIVEQVHFHWGHSHDNISGSEHSLDGRSYPLEIHMVTYSNWFSNISNAASNTRALAVIGAFFELSEKPNPFLQPIVEALKHIHRKGTSTNISKEFDLRSLLDEKRMRRYYRYDGSLTTPPCYESVIWSVLQEPLPISMNQLREFRSLHDEHGRPLVNTYRQKHPIGTRKLFRSFHSQNIADDEPKQRTSTANNQGRYTSINMKIALVVIGLLIITIQKKHIL